MPNLQVFAPQKLGVSLTKTLNFRLQPKAKRALAIISQKE